MMASNQASTDIQMQTMEKTSKHVNQEMDTYSTFIEAQSHGSQLDKSVLHSQARNQNITDYLVQPVKQHGYDSFLRNWSIKVVISSLQQSKGIIKAAWL